MQAGPAVIMPGYDHFTAEEVLRLLGAIVVSGLSCFGGFRELINKGVAGICKG